VLRTIVQPACSDSFCTFAPMSWTNFHTHTTFCDGHAEPVVFVEAALEQQLSVLGFSSHAPVCFPNRWTMNPARVRDYHREIMRLKELYSGRIELYCGLEMDYFPDILGDCQSLYAGVPWDYKIGAVHFIGAFPDGSRWCMDGSGEAFREGLHTLMDGDFLSAVKQYFALHRSMVQEMPVDVVAHFDKIKLQYRPGDKGGAETDAEYRRELLLTLDAFEASGCVVEVSTRGIAKGNLDDFYPGSWVIPEMARRGIPVTLNSDAHRPWDLTLGFDRAAQALYASGYREISVLRAVGWQMVPFGPDGLML